MFSRAGSAGLHSGMGSWPYFRGFDIGWRARKEDSVAGVDGDLPSRAGSAQGISTGFAASAANSPRILRPGARVVLGIGAGRDRNSDARLHTRS